MRLLALPFALAALLMLAVTPCAHAAPLPASPPAAYAPTAIDDSPASVPFGPLVRVRGERMPNIFAMGARPVDCSRRIWRTQHK